jgi:hypothetical protein
MACSSAVHPVKSSVDESAVMAAKAVILVILFPFVNNLY